MRITLSLRGPLSRFAIIVTTLFAAAAFLSLSAARFITAVISDPDVQAETEVIEGAANYFSNSAPVQARMASRIIESGVDQAESYEQVTERANYYASRAVALSPRNYEFRILSAAAREMKGDLEGAESELRAALALAPHHVIGHWRLANLLVRKDKLDQAISEFKIVVAADPGRLMTTLDLLWQASDGKIDSLIAVARDNHKSQLTLARFLARQEKYEASVKIATALDNWSTDNIPELGQLLDAMITAGQIAMANRIWRDVYETGDQPLIWNGSFETLPRSGLTQFDWNISQSKYAGIGISNAGGRTGQRSIKIVYLGIDTTRLDGEIRQLIQTRPGSRYTLSCYAKAENLVTPEGPQLVITMQDTATPIAKSAVLESGTYEWRPLELEFTAPSNAKSLIVSVKHTPRFSYVEPTRGTVWFDDFVLTEQPPDSQSSKSSK